ncbi:amine oxidase [Dentipellis sp. KUC8613]|nr:amine oxidase [Dentipellis sp. KUC8613]
MPANKQSVCIVGGGVAGLYSALLLQEQQDYDIHILEASNRIGGRIHTHRFTHEKNQYFEAGAMRIPRSAFHAPVFDLIDHLNDLPCATLSEDKRIQLMPYRLNSPGNKLFINSTQGDGCSVWDTLPSAVGWTVPPQYERSARDLMLSAIGPLVDALHDDFDKGFEKLLAFDEYPFRQYLQSVVGWPSAVVDFMETLTSQSNQFMLSTVEMVMQFMDFNTKDWVTIADGMDRLPLAMAHTVGLEHITFGARVTGVFPTESGRLTVRASAYHGELKETFDKVLFAIPPAALKMIVDRPRWSPSKECAIRAMHFEPLYKMGLRFKTRFWERLPTPSCGGQSTTDLPIRWVVYPSYGIGEDGPGVLLLYAWMTDATTWLPLSEAERRTLALQCLARLYDDQVDVYGQLIETFDVAWCATAATGDAMFLPGQFRPHFEAARCPEGNIFFAGEHLSRHHTWISGAIESALQSVRDIVGSQDIPALGTKMEVIQAEETVVFVRMDPSATDAGAALVTDVTDAPVLAYSALDSDIENYLPQFHTDARTPRDFDNIRDYRWDWDMLQSEPQGVNILA